MSTELGQQQFVNDWWGSAQQVSAQTGFAPELVLATWSLDTGWGDAAGMMRCHALLGIVPFKGDVYPSTLCNDSLCFYCFPTWQDFLDTYAEVINESRYDVVRLQGTIEGQASALATQTGFAGGSSSYLGSLISVMQKNAQWVGQAPSNPAPQSGQAPGLGSIPIIGPAIQRNPKLALLGALALAVVLLGTKE